MMQKSMRIVFALALLAGCFLAVAASAEETSTRGGVPEYQTVESVGKLTKQQFSPYAGRNFPTRFFGVTPTCTLPCPWTPALCAA